MRKLMHRAAAIKRSVSALFGVQSSALPPVGLAELAEHAARRIGPTVEHMVGPWRRFGVSFTGEQQDAIKSGIEKGTVEGLVEAQKVILTELERCYG